MALTKLSLEKFTVFEKLDIEFSKGINVLIGENGTGKTHIMKVLYSACQAAQAKGTAIDFSTKMIKVFKPDDSGLHRLVKRENGAGTAKVKVCSDHHTLSLEFHSRRKENISVKGRDAWQEEFAGLTSTFIPAKEILSNSHNLIQAIDKGNVDFDDTYKDIISAASVDITKGPEGGLKKKYLKSLQKITNGTVSIKNEEFYLKPGNQSMLEFQLIAEGIRKIALLWQLIKNGTLENGSVLFWDEPEANINPKHIPALVDILLNLQSDGVQIFIATHDYILAKYLEIKRTGGSSVLFHSLYKIENEDRVAHESNQNFRDLSNNVITESFNVLLDEIFNNDMED